MRQSLEWVGLFLFMAVAGVGSNRAEAAEAAEAAEPVPAHQTFTLKAAKLQETRRINVYLPPGYDAAGTTRYPVLYMPDGGVKEDFPHIATTVDTAIRAGEMKPRNASEPPTRGAIFRSSSTWVGPVMSRRRSVFSMPTRMKGRIVPFPTDTCTSPATCRKSSAMPPSGM